MWCEMRLSVRPSDAVLLSTCSLAQCPIAFGWAATWYVVAWRCGWAGWDQLSTHGGRSFNCSVQWQRWRWWVSVTVRLMYICCIQFRLMALNWVMRHVCGGYKTIWMTKTLEKKAMSCWEFTVWILGRLNATSSYTLPRIAAIGHEGCVPRSWRERQVPFLDHECDRNGLMSKLIARQKRPSGPVSLLCTNSQ